MKKCKFFLSLLLVFAYFSSCYKKTNVEGDFFYLQNKNVYLPVWVRGNKDAEHLIIVIHGGPGGDDGIYMHLEPFRRLQETHLMVYYDQRASGASQSSLVTSYTANDHIQDLEKLVHLIQDKYGKNKKMILMGHSWGGMLGGLYLQKGRNRELIHGFINVDGAYATIADTEYVALVTTAQRQIDANNSIHFWQKILQKLAYLNPNSLRLYDLSLINRLGYDAENTLQTDGIIEKSQGFDYYNYFYNSAYHPSIYAINEVFINTLMFQQAYQENLSLAPAIQNLLTPTCLLWGQHDLVVAASTLGILLQELPTVVYAYYFEQSGHSPMLSEPTLFVQQITTCVSKFSEI